MLRFLAMLAVCAVTACGSRSISGVYVHSTDTEVAALQLVGTEDGNLTGSLQTASIRESNELSSGNVPLTGAIDGDALTLSAPVPMFGTSTTFFGERSGNEITLTVTTRDSVVTIPFRRADAGELARLSDELRQRQRAAAVEIAEQRTAAQIQANDQAMRNTIPNLSAELERLAAGYSERAPRLEAATSRFAALTEQAREAARGRDREPDGVRQNELSIYINQVTIDTDGIGIELEGAERDFNTQRATMQRELAQVSPWCARTRDPVCARLTTAASTYNTAATARAAAFARANAAYANAEAEQARLQ
jgi:hypothetical protein